MKKVAIIGFGEAGMAFAKGWGKTRHFQFSAFDIKASPAQPVDDAIAIQKQKQYKDYGVDGTQTLKAALVGADVVLSLVTADQAHQAACEAALFIERDAFYFDGNSCAPDTKKKSAAKINNAGGQYIDMAIMAPVQPTLNKTPVLLGGEFGDACADVVQALGLNAKIMEGPVGHASAIKMTRSIMMKGLEALMLECVLAGRKAGVDDVVLESLEATYPGFGWKQRAAYMFERVMTHGIRRAAEMREVAITVDDLELDGTMAAASIDWHQRIGELGIDLSGLEQTDYRELADILLKTGKFGPRKQ